MNQNPPRERRVERYGGHCSQSSGTLPTACAVGSDAMSYFRQHIEAMEGYVPGEQPTDPSVIKLNTNENPYPPSPRVIEAIGQIAPEQLRRYPDPMGNRFRDTAAQVFGVARENVICGNGMDDILNMTVRAFSGPEA